MGKYQSDTESESYRYDDSNNTSDESVTDLNIPDFNDKNAIQIAEYLDKRLHQDINKKTTEVAIGTDSNNQQRSFHSPLPEKLWTPLSQSTPTDIPKTRAQPKDILKAKSKLSKLSVTANDSNPSIGEDEDYNSQTEESSTSPSFNDETPSKSSKIKVSIQKNTQKQEQELKELQELRELKKYLSTVPNGSLILDNFKTTGAENKINIMKQEDSVSTEKEIQSLRDQVANFENQKLSLQEEISILKSSNSDLKENIELKNGTIEHLRTELYDSNDKLGQAQLFNKEAEEKIQDLEKKLKDLFGDIEEEVTPQRYPLLNVGGSSGKPLYDELDLQLVDSLNLIKSRNTIKNILINLQIPFSEAKQIIPKVGRLLQDEDVLCEFTNKLHSLLYKRKLNISKFLNETEGNQHLRECTSQMYRNFELLFQSSKYSDF